MSDAHSLTTAVNQAIESALEDHRIVGTVVMVAKGDEVIYRRAAGLQDRENAINMQQDAIFRLSSITKPLVSVAAMRLVERGLIGLEQPVTQWLHDFRPKLRDGSEPVILIHHLLAHMSGLSYGFLEPEESEYHLFNVSDGLDQPGLELRENLQRLAKAPLLFNPGSAWKYSLATDVLGAVLEAATGLTLAQIIRQEITEPLALRDSDFAVSDPSRLAVPYANAEPRPLRMTHETALPLWGGKVKFHPDRILHPGSYPSGGCGMAGTAEDILRFLMHIKPGGSALIRPETLEIMLKDHAGPEAQALGPGWGFGYGWAVLSDPEMAASPQAKGTLQWGGVYGHSWFVDTENDLRVVILTNTAFEGMCGQLVNDIRDAVYGSLS